MEKEGELEKEKKRKSLTGRYEIRPACSQTCDRGLGKKASWGGEFLRRIRAERKSSVQRKNGGILKMKGGVNLRKQRQTESTVGTMGKTEIKLTTNSAVSSSGQMRL